MKKIRGFEVVSKYIGKIDKLPERATRYSAGYDMQSSEDITIPSIWRTFFKELFTYFTQSTDWRDYKDIMAKSLKPTLVSTGVKAYMQDNEVLKLFNRSSNPLKLGLILSNGVGVIDKDYYNNPDNEGEIKAQFINIFPYDIEIKKGQRICQGIFEQFLLADGDNAEGERNGGFGSTN